MELEISSWSIIYDKYSKHTNISKRLYFTIWLWFTTLKHKHNMPETWRRRILLRGFWKIILFSSLFTLLSRYGDGKIVRFRHVVGTNIISIIKFQTQKYSIMNWYHYLLMYELVCRFNMLEGVWQMETMFYKIISYFARFRVPLIILYFV